MDEIRARAKAFSTSLQQIKQDNPPKDFSWYGYDIMANFGALDGLLQGENRALFYQLAGANVADIGGADGDLGFFLETMGAKVDLVDFPLTNWNGLRGARRLKELLGSNVAIHEIDLDSQFRLPRRQYDLVVFLGILYHLKNPFYALEQLAGVSRQMLLSTRVIRFTGATGQEVSGVPVAYLVAPDECNNDATNFWLFSETGLHQIVSRAGWEVTEYITYGDKEQSNPQDNEHDQRAFMLLSSQPG